MQRAMLLNKILQIKLIIAIMIILLLKIMAAQDVALDLF